MGGARRRMNPVARFSSITYTEPQVPPGTRSKWGWRRGSALSSVNFEIVGLMVGYLPAWFTEYIRKVMVVFRMVLMSTFCLGSGRGMTSDLRKWELELEQSEPSSLLVQDTQLHWWGLLLGFPWVWWKRFRRFQDRVWGFGRDADFRSTQIQYRIRVLHAEHYISYIGNAVVRGHLWLPKTKHKTILEHSFNVSTMSVIFQIFLERTSFLWDLMLT